MRSEVQLADFEAAALRIAPFVIRSPLLPLYGCEGREIRLKAENLQQLGSFKIRAAYNALLETDRDLIAGGIATASAGNFAQGLALAARQQGARLTVHAPDTAARVKCEALARLGATVVSHPFNDWWQILTTRQTGEQNGVFVHPVSEPAVLVGNGTIGLELIETWPELDSVVIPIGGGGLAAGIALAIRASGRKVRIIGCEVETAAPLSAAFAAGKPVPIERKPSFIDGIGSNRVLEEMWPLLRELIDEVVVVSLDEAKAGVRALAASNHLIVEGAAAVALAAARSPRCPGRRVAAILSGGNIDVPTFCELVSDGSA
jgi:threonine dehydratase